MRSWQISLMLILLFIVNIPSQAAQRRIIFVKEWEQGLVNPVFDNIYNTIVREFTLSDSFLIMDNKEFEAKTNIILTSIFPDVIDPLMLVELNQKLQLDIVMLLSEQQENMYINTLEFPSGVTIDKFLIDKSDLASANPELMVKLHLGALIESLIDRYSPCGYPFHKSENGVIIITKDIQNTFVKENLGQLKQYYSQTVLPTHNRPLRIKIMQNELNCEAISQLCSKTGAAFALGFAPDTSGLMDYRLTLTFPYMGNNRPYIDVEFPYLASNEQLVCYEFAGQNPSMEQLGDMIFNERIDYKQIEILPIFLHKLLILHKEWAVKKPDTTIDPENINNYYILLYNKLPENSLANAWIGVNYAGYYMQIGQYVTAGPLFAKAYNTFTTQSDPQGIILSLLGTAKVASMLKNYTLAKRAYENVLKVYTIKDDSVTVAAVNYNLGLIAELNNSASAAINYYETSAYMYNKVNDKYKAMQIYQRIARLLASTGEKEKSVDYYNLYLARAEELYSEPDVAEAQYELGLAGYNDNNLKEASQHFQNASNYYEMLGEQNDNQAIINLKMGVIGYKNRDYTEAQKYLSAALTNIDKISPVDNVYELYRYLGDLEATNKNWLDAQNFYDRGLAISTQAKSQPKMAEFIYRKGLAHLKEGKVDLGYTEVKKGIDMSDGAVHGGRKNANEFLNKLDSAIKK